jgi:hypothetical protein
MANSNRKMAQVIAIYGILLPFMANSSQKMAKNFFQKWHFMCEVGR